MTGREFCQQALRLVNILDAVETIDAEQLRDTFQILGDVVEELSINRQLIYRVVRTVFTLTSGQASYTIGPGGQFNVPRPLWIDNVGVIPNISQTPVLETPIGPMLTMDQYAAIPVKTIAGPFPTMAFYDYEYDPSLLVGLANVKVYPVPNTSTARLVLYLPTPIPAFGTYGEDYTFPPGYRRLIKYKLAAEMCGFYERAVPQRVEKTLMKAERDVKAANFRPQDAQFDRRLVGRSRVGGYNIYTDGSS